MFKKIIDFIKKKLGRDDTNMGDALKEAQESGELSGGENQIGLNRMLQQGNNMTDLPDDEVGEDKPAGENKQKDDFSGFDMPEADASMSQGEKGMIYGLKRKVVIGVIIFIGFLVGSALVYNTSKSSEPTKQEKTTSSQQIAGAKSLSNLDSADDLSDDYGEQLKRANAEKLKKNGGGNQPANVQAQKTASANTAPASSTVRPSSSQDLPAVPRSTVISASPVIPPSYSQPYSLPSQQMSAPSTQSQQQTSSAEKSELEKIKDSIASAIGFSIGGGQQVADNSPAMNGGQSEDSTQAQPTQSVAYVAPSPNTVTAGTIIPAMLLTGINTDTPGQVIAQVMGDVYDSSGSNLLIPAGSRILGKMNSSGGQTGRVGVTFSQIVMPDGGAWAIGDSLVAVDAEGYNGLEGTVHKHTGANFATGLFNSALSALSTINVDRVTLDTGSLFNEMNNRAATTTIDPGYQFNVYVTNNISF